MYNNPSQIRGPERRNVGWQETHAFSSLWACGLSSFKHGITTGGYTFLILAEATFCYIGARSYLCKLGDKVLIVLVRKNWCSKELWITRDANEFDLHFFSKVFMAKMCLKKLFVWWIVSLYEHCHGSFKIWALCHLQVFSRLCLGYLFWLMSWFQNELLFLSHKALSGEGWILACFLLCLQNICTLLWTSKNAAYKSSVFSTCCSHMAASNTTACTEI